jgi:hypothetical protein
LQRLSQVSRESTVVLARHDSFEAAAQREASLRAELGDDGFGGQVVVWIQPKGDRTRSEGRKRESR